MVHRGPPLLALCPSSGHFQDGGRSRQASLLPGLNGAIVPEAEAVSHGLPRGNLTILRRLARLLLQARGQAFYMEAPAGERKGNDEA